MKIRFYDKANIYVIDTALFVLQLKIRYLNVIYLHSVTFGSTDPLSKIYVHTLLIAFIHCYTFFVWKKRIVPSTT